MLAGLLVAALASATPAAAQKAATQVAIHADQPQGTVSPRIFGQFAEHLGTGIYGGIWVGPESSIPNVKGYRTDVVEALRKLQVPVVRWPGGCFADEYNWREGIGPRDRRPVKINTHWGGVTENNAFGTHEFMDFAELIGAEAYVSGNVGNAPPREMAEWVEYMTSPTGSSLAREREANGRKEPWKVPLFGIGNELWGCGGQMRAEYAADVARRYATFLKVPSGQKMLKIASGASDGDLDWTETLMRIAGKQIDALALHHYAFPTGNWDKKGAATGFPEAEWASLLSSAYLIEELITKHSAIMDKYDPEKRVWLAVDEWGNWYDVEPGTNPGFLYQQNTIRDAVSAALNINSFSRHTDRVKLANIAQMVNVLQGMILTKDAEMVLTPTYHVFDMYRPFQDATALAVEAQAPRYRFGKHDLPAIDVAAVRAKDGRIHVALVNLDPNRTNDVEIRLSGSAGKRVSGRILTAPAMDAHNSFERPNAVAPKPFAGAQLRGGTLRATLPAKAVVMLALD
ncbi:MAG TPA: alpha-L-arabinofuranosidase C-terminal domain-containing protein [Sphingomicrobium sp.]|nr:alpha-L-arabinofuranosidase C-terminal domain-containing protein [Sphingomicrobium sp.]